MWEQSTKFWSGRNAFRAATVARQAGKSTSVVTPSGRFTIPSLEGYESRWQARANRMQLPGGMKATTIRVVDGATPLVRRLLTKLAPALTAAFDRELGGAALNALYNWPVSSGLSKASIFLGYRANDIEFIGTIGNAAPYAIYIKGNPWNKLIRQPAKQAAHNIASTIRIGA